MLGESIAQPCLAAATEVWTPLVLDKKFHHVAKLKTLVKEPSIDSNSLEKPHKPLEGSQPLIASPCHCLPPSDLISLTHRDSRRHP